MQKTNERYVVETITMTTTTVTERHILREAGEDLIPNNCQATTIATTLTTPSSGSSSASRQQNVSNQTISSTNNNNNNATLNVSYSSASQLGMLGGSSSDSESLLPPALPAKPGLGIMTNSDDMEKPPPIPPKEGSPTSVASSTITTTGGPTQISGILKGGKLWKQDSISQVRKHFF